MSPTGIRFRPPEISLTPELRWVFSRAFGPPGSYFAEEIRAEKALELARLFEISPRIASRHDPAQLRQEIGAVCHAQLVDDRRRTTFLALQRDAAARDIAKVGAAVGVPLVFLKFLALRFSGAILPGSREASDIDILIPSQSLERFYETLQRGEYVARDRTASEHHFPILDHPRHGPVEIHKFVPGVKADENGPSASYEVLEANHLLRQLSDWPGECSIPTLEIQIAHTLAHGVAQHGAHPDAYLPVRMLADAVDLGNAENATAAFERAKVRIHHAVSPEEAVAVWGLSIALRRGYLPWEDGLTSDSPIGIFLRHIVAAALNSDYRNALNLRFFTAGLTDRRPVVVVSAILKRAVFPSRGELDEIYGTTTTPTGYLGRRLARPFGLIARLVRYLASTIRLRVSRH